MFDAEKLLGKVVNEFMGSGGKKKKKGKKYKNNLLSSLGSGAGLMTAIGLGIGAYEILKDKQSQGSQSSGRQQYTPPPPPGSSPASPPPIPPVPGQQSPIQPPVPAVKSPAEDRVPANSVEQELAIRMMQVMIAAAHADGTMDSDEEEKILARAAGAGLSPEEKQFLLIELHNPKSIEQLTDGITDPAIGKALYMAATGSISIDTPEERSWLDQFAGALGLSKAVQTFIEEEH